MPSKATRPRECDTNTPASAFHSDINGQVQRSAGSAGKTLALRCADVLWRQAHHNRMHLMFRHKHRPRSLTLYFLELHGPLEEPRQRSRGRSLHMRRAFEQRPSELLPPFQQRHSKYRRVSLFAAEA